MRTTISRKLKWLEPYLEIGMQFIPDGKKLSRVTAVKYGGRYLKDAWGQISTDDEKVYRLYLHTQYHPRWSKEVLTFSKIELLRTFAHEMAHMIEIDAHTPDHAKLEDKIHAAFMAQLKREGYVSVEEEETERDENLS